MDCEKHHKRFGYTAKISRWRRACPLTDEQRALRETEELKGRFTATFSRSQNELYEALCDREEFAGLHWVTAIFAQGVKLGLRLAFEALG